VRALAVGVLERDHLEDAHAEGVDVGELVVRLRVHLRRHELRRAHDAPRGCGAADGGEPEVADLDLALAPVHEDVVALEVAVDDPVRVQVGEAVQHLPAPAPDGGAAHAAVQVPVLPERAGGEELRDEVDGAAGRVHPGRVQPHDGAVAEGFEEVDLAVEAFQLAGAAEEAVQPHLVPRHLHASVLVEGAVPARSPHHHQSTSKG
jgi:hypothetical protein